jgi:hypothetical protein
MRTRTRRSRFSRLMDALETRRLMATFSVTSNADTNTAGTLRWAINQANLTAAADVISFNLAATTISPTTALPTISQPVTIDGTTQPGYAGAPLVTLNGANAPTAGAGFFVTGTDVVIRGLAIGNYSANGGAGVIAGIGSLRTTVRDCYLGLSPSGSAMPNYDGFRAFGLASQVLYSTVAANQRHGVWLSEDGGKVYNSTVGLSPTGTAMGNGSVGVYINGGDYCIVENSIVSGNVGTGIHIDLPATNAIVRNNIIGMNAARTALRTNGTTSVYMRNTSGQITGNRIATSNSYGIFIDNCDYATVETNNIGFGANTAADFGGTTGVLLAASNYCTIRMNQIGHSGTGIHLYGSHRNAVVANGIGALLDNATAVPNDVGVKIELGEDNVIGTDVEAGPDGNVISFNAGEGVRVLSGVRNAILGNRFRNNGGLDIDLGPVGPTLNDSGDADTGANTLLNTISKVFGAYNPQGTNSTIVNYRAGHEFTTAGTYRVDFYASENNKTVNEIGEGTRFLVSRTINFSGKGELTFTSDLPLQIDGTYVCATVTRLVNGVATDTSEFSQAMRVEGAPQILGSSFEYATRHTVNFRFSRSVLNSVTPDDVTVRNLATNQVYTATSRDQVAGTTSYNWYFNTLPDGNYRATLNRDTVGATVQLGPSSVDLDAVGPNTLDFFVLKGDANRDRKVNFDDLLILASNYNTSGKTFSQGNFNYNTGGNVNFDDLLILASNYNKSLPAAAPAPLAAPGGTSGDDDSTGNDVLA